VNPVSDGLEGEKGNYVIDAYFRAPKGTRKKNSKSGYI